MRNIPIAVMAFVSVAISGCAQPTADQRELARAHWLSGVKEIIRSGDLADYHNVATQLNLDLSAAPPFQAKDVDGNVTGNNFEVETVPAADRWATTNIRFHYGIYIPNDQSYQIAILTARNFAAGACITASDIYSNFGYAQGKNIRTQLPTVLIITLKGGT